MAKQINVGVGGVVKTVKEVPIGIGGVVKKAKKGVCGIGGVVKEFWSGGNPITKLVRSKHCSVDKSSSQYITFHSTYEDAEAYGYVYGDFSNKSYSFTMASGDPDDCSVSITIGYKKDASSGYVYGKNIYFTKKETQTGTFPALTEYFRFQGGGYSDYSNDARVYSVIVDGVEYIDYLREKTWSSS